MAHSKVLQVVLSAPKRVKVGTRTTKSGNVVGVYTNNPNGSVPVKTITHQRAFN
jgi:hypothetical protein